MERITFDMSKFPDRLDQLNVMSMFIVNRAAQFDKMKYNRIIVEIDDDSLGCTTYNFMRIINEATGVPVYCKWKAKKARFVTKNKAFKFRPKFWLNHLMKKDDTLYLDAESNMNFQLSTSYPKIYAGFMRQELDEIATKLYGWQDDLESYEVWEKEMKREEKELKNASNNN